MLTLYTVSISQWRKAEAIGAELYDITVVSGDRMFSPDPSILWAYKAGQVSEKDYTDAYLERMNRHFAKFNDYFFNWLKREGDLAVGCYCHADAYCHRHLFIDFIMDIAKDYKLPVEFHGEIV